MRDTTRKQEDLPTIWSVPDDLWAILSNLIAQHDPPRPRGRKRIDARQALNGILYRARTGCQWNQLPETFGDDSSVHRTQQRWEKCGLFDKLWATLLENCQDLGAVDWDWQSADGCLSKARGVPKKGHKNRRSEPTPQIGEKPVSKKVCS